MENNQTQYDIAKMKKHIKVLKNCINSDHDSILNFSMFIPKLNDITIKCLDNKRIAKARKDTKLANYWNEQYEFQLDQVNWFKDRIKMRQKSIERDHETIKSFKRIIKECLLNESEK